MDILQLPSLPAVTPIKQAWSILEAAQRSAIITTYKNAPAIVTAEGLAVGENHGASALSDLKLIAVPIVMRVPGHRAKSSAGSSGEWAPVLEALDRASIRKHMIRTRLGDPHHEIRYDPDVQVLIDKMLRGINLNFALVGMSPGGAILVSSHEGGVRPYSGPPKRCWCKNPKLPHGFDDKKTGDSCDFDKYDVSCRR